MRRSRLRFLIVIQQSFHRIILYFLHEYYVSRDMLSWLQIFITIFLVKTQLLGHAYIWLRMPQQTNFDASNCVIQKCIKK